MQSLWRVQNFLNSTYGLLDIRELSNCNLGGQQRSKTQGCSRRDKVRNQRSIKKFLLPSVTTPNVPSAPIKSLVVSKPAADFLARLRVLMISPLGSTTVLGATLEKILREWILNTNKI